MGFQIVTGRLNMLGNGPDICKNRQRIGISKPSGNDVKMQMLFNAGSRNFT
jgi:hypothetical protein